MLLLAKLTGVLVLVWFFTTGKKMGENPIKWAIIGLIGYWLAWWIGNKLILGSLVGMFSKKTFIIYLVTQIPVVCGAVAAFFVRKKLIKIAEKEQGHIE
jgi:hypothetical protein